MGFNGIATISITIITIILQTNFASLQGCRFHPIGEFMRFVRVPENQQIGEAILHVNVSPRNNLELQSIDKKEDVDYFNIKDVNDTTVAVILSRSLEDVVDSDNPQNILKFRLSCNSSLHDDSSDSYLTITVYVEDVNDHSPVFIDAPYQVVLDESIPIGLTVFRNIHAIDRDKPNTPNSDIEYSIVSGNDKGKFILSSNHRPNVLTKKLLDYDTGDKQFNLTISAADRGIPSRVTNTTLLITVRDDDDLNPTFTKGVYRTSINEFYPFNGDKISEKLHFDPEIFAFDQDVGIDTAVRYDIIAGNERELFSISHTNGSLYLQKKIDLDQEHSIPANTFVLQIQASQIDNNLKTSLARVEIEILDLNDNQPEFESAFWNISIVENLPNGFSVLHVIANDADQGENAEFTYHIKNFQDYPLEMNLKTGWLTVSDQNQLDREVKSSFSIKVFAVEKNPSIIPNLEPSSTTVQISLLDANDNNPKFVPSNLYEFTTTSGVKIGDRVGAVKATDRDLGPNSVVKYSIQKTSSQNTSCPFRIDEDTGKIFTRDSPLAEGKHGFFVEASDQSVNPSVRRYSLAVVTIEVVKSDSEGSSKPEFIGAPFEYWIADNSEIGTTVGQINVRNVADDNTLEFDLLHSYHEGVPFAIEEKSGTISVIEDIKKFQRSKYEFETVVFNQNQDVMLSSNVTIHAVNPDDMEQRLIRDQLNPIEYHVNENIAGALIGQLFFKNLTNILKNKSIKFTIANQKDTDGKIIISQDGTLYTHEALDREEKDVYHLTIIAQYHHGLISGTSIYQVIVHVDDENDNAPIFENDLYEGRIKENCISGTEVDLNHLIRANDYDSGANGQFTFTLFGEGSKMFKINKKTGKIYFISASSPLDRESKSVYHFRLTATDKGGRHSKVKLIIRILDENDNAPAFKKVILFPFKGMDILSFGKGINSKIDLVQEWDNNITTIPETRGIQHRNFILHLSIPENTKIGNTLLRLQAEDMDETGNSFIEYSLVNENFLPKKLQISQLLSPRKELQPHFMVHPATGDVSLTRSLTSQSQLVLNFTTTDSKFQGDFLQIKFSVKDINDHAPTFKISLYIFDVYENVPIGTTIGIVEAYDNEDVGDNSKIVYELVVDENFTNSFPFAISNHNGVIKVKRNLNRERLDKYNFGVIAYDNPTRFEDRLNSTVEVQVNVLDVNDNSPKFFNYNELIRFPNSPDDKFVPVYYVNAVENCPLGTSIIKLEANDSDLPANGNGLFLFEILNNLTNARDKTLFSIDSKDGSLITIGKLDFETTPVHNITILVTDFGSPRLSSIALVSISVIDVLEEESERVDPNIFIHRLYEIEVDENIPVPVKIVTLNVSELYRHKLLKYRLVSDNNDHLNYFRIEPHNGTVIMIKSPDYEKYHRYEFKVIADKLVSGRELPVVIYPINPDTLAFNEAKIIVNVKDVNDNAPRFPTNGKPLITAIPASVAFGHSILMLKAEDLDSDLNSEIRYQILYHGDSEDSRFTIDHKTGEIRTSSSFLKDADKIFGFDVKATDQNGSDSGKSTIANVFVYILDDDKQLIMMFDKKPMVLEKFLFNITKKLNKITGYDTRIQKIEPHFESNYVDDDITDMYIYAVDSVFNNVIPVEKLKNQLREKKSLLRQELIDYDFNDIRYGALGNKQKMASLFSLFSMEFWILFFAALFIIGIIMAVYYFSYVQGIQRNREKSKKFPFESNSMRSFKVPNLRNSSRKLDQFQSVEPLRSYSQAFLNTPVNRLSKFDKTIGSNYYQKKSLSFKRPDEGDGFVETAANSLHSSGKDSGITDNNCSTPDKCPCRYCVNNSSDEFSKYLDLSYEDSLESECKIHGGKPSVIFNNNGKRIQSRSKIVQNDDNVTKVNNKFTGFRRYSSKC